jgi:hypothetical protein
MPFADGINLHYLKRRKRFLILPVSNTSNIWSSSNTSAAPSGPTPSARLPYHPPRTQTPSSPSTPQRCPSPRIRCPPQWPPPPPPQGSATHRMDPAVTVSFLHCTSRGPWRSNALPRSRGSTVGWSLRSRHGGPDLTFPTWSSFSSWLHQASPNTLR